MTSNHASPPALQRAHIHCPITALAFYPPPLTGTSTNPPLLLLSGQDTHLHIHTASDHRLLASISVFAAQPIQGISTSPAGDVLVWGGPWIAFLAREQLLHAAATAAAATGPAAAVVVSTLSKSQVLRGADWIYHAALASPTLAAVVTAHNEVVPLHINININNRNNDVKTGCTATSTSTTQKQQHGASALRWGRVRAPPSSRPILYAARLEWVGPPAAGEVLVAAGTVFGEIVVWRCWVEEEVDDDADADADADVDEDVEVLYVFTGHEGSIFGVDLSPEVIVAGRPTRLLASCSDDRTIRVWDVSASSSRRRPVRGDGAEENKVTTSRSFPAARETGFGENGVSDLEAQAGCVSSAPVAVAMGHVSRIWAARFAPSSSSSSSSSDCTMTVYSFGEDATVQRWRLDIEGLGVATATSSSSSSSSSNGSADTAAGAAAGLVAGLSHETILHRHNGKHIWSSALLAPISTGPTMMLVATGGSDGKINIAEEVPAATDTRSVLLDISGTEVVRSFPDAATKAVVNGPATDALPEASSKEEEKEKKKKKKQKRGKTDVEQEPFLMYALLSDTSTIATTATGRIFRGSLRGGSHLSWSEVVLPTGVRDDLRQYQIVRSVGVGIALLGSTSGGLYVYRDGLAVEQVCKLPRKISDIFTLPAGDLAALGLGDDGDYGAAAAATASSSSSSSSSVLLPIIVSTMGSSLVTLVILSLGGASGHVVQQEHVIELGAGFIPTAVGCCGGCLIFGSRNGALMAYKTRPGSEMTREFEMVARVERPFTRDAVSSIIPLPPKAGGPAAPYFLTTSRDGRYRIYEVTSNTATTTTTNTHPDAIQLHLRHEAVPPLGPMIESAVFTPATPSSPPELILAGFRSRYFIVWNETRQRELASVECGGAFRAFTHRVDPCCPARVAFIWTRASRTCVFVQTGLSQRVLKPGGHGREIKAVAACDAAGLWATGAEDTTVRIWSYDHHNHDDDDDDDDDDNADTTGNRQDEVGMRCLAVIEKHTTGIQCLKWAGANYLLSSSGNEELFIWRVTRLDKSAYEGLAVVCEGAYPDRTRDGDLRIMGFDVEVLPRVGSGGAHSKTSDDNNNNNNEDEDEDESLCLSLVLSNSTLRTYKYSRRTKAFALLAEGRYTGACLVQLRHLRVARGGAEVHVLTAATDGHVALWKMEATAATATYELVEVARLHQSSIKSLDLKRLRSAAAAAAADNDDDDDEDILVVTGGDDNALGYLSLAWSSARRCYVVSSRGLANGAHAAAVTGLCITSVAAMPDGTGSSSVAVCTASNDQRVKSWRMVLGGDARLRRVKQVQDRYSAVADCGEVEVLNGGRQAVVVGVGMEVWTLPSI